MTDAATLAARSAAYDARKRQGGLCIEGGCWRKAAKARVRCNAHLTAAREAAKAKRTKTAGAGTPTAASTTAQEAASNGTIIRPARKRRTPAN